MGAGRLWRSVVIAGLCVSLAGGVWAAIGTAAIESPEYLKSFGPDGAETSSFSFATSIAVDQQTHHVYVADVSAGSLYKFDEEGQPVDFSGSASYISDNAITGLPFLGGASENQIAVDSQTHVIYVTTGNKVRAFAATGEPAEFSGGPGAGTSEIGGFTELVGVAVDAFGNIYASDYGPGGAGAISIYASSGEPITTFSVTEPSTIAVAPDGRVYVVKYNGPVTVYSPSLFPPTGTTTYTPAPEPLGPNSAITVSIDPSNGDAFVLEREGASRIVAIYDASGSLKEAFGQSGEEGELEERAGGVAVDGSAERVYVSNSSVSGPSVVAIFTPFEPPVGPPTPEAVSVTDLTESSATLQARINPNTRPTSYYFEYGATDCQVSPSSCTKVPAGGASIGSGFEPVPVSDRVSGLSPGTTYFYRVVAENNLGVIPSPTRTFRTQPFGAGFLLSDSRAWEMVSPQNKQGALLLGVEGGVVQASPGGEAIAYSSVGSIEVDPDGNRAAERSAVLSRRGTAGWESKDISPPHFPVTPIAAGDEFKLLREDLSGALLQQRDFLPLSPAASDRTIYLRENTNPATYLPLVTSKEGYANVEPGTEIGGDDSRAFPFVFIAGSSPDLRHVVVSSERPLEPTGPANALYKWNAGELEPISVLPDTEGGGVVGGILGSQQGSVEHAISDDGSRVFWSPGEYNSNGINTEALYVYDWSEEGSSRLDVPQPGVSGPGAASPAFQGASADGTRVLFTDSRQLTEDASPEGRDLYSCEIGTVGDSLGCASLTNISEPIEGSGESAHVLGLLPALGDDASRAYFIAKGVLDTEPNENGEAAVAGEPNLYFWSDGESPRFIATLSFADGPTWGRVNANEGLGYAGRQNAAGSPSGRYFAFMSENGLTGYVNDDAVSGEPAQEVFLYDSRADHLECISCNPSGASPEGETVEPESAADPAGLWTGRRAAAILPQSSETGGADFLYPLYRPRALLDNGRVFFNAVDGLVSGDSNRTWDVYQYEPLGLGSCADSSSGSSISRSGNGCVGLISSGTGAEAVFLDASLNGDDAFFLTSTSLSPLDVDEVPDVYDARVNGRSAVPSLPPDCAGEGCRSSGGLVVDSIAPASSLFSGPGNLAKSHRKHCGKGKRKVQKNGRKKCVRVRRAGKGGNGGRKQRGGEGR